MSLTLQEIATPALVINLAAVERNLARLSSYAKGHGLTICPHTKTHKSLRFAREQIRHGSTALAVAKAGEAQVMAQTGVEIFVAYPALDPARGKRLAELARQNRVRVGVDSTLAALSLAASAKAASSVVGIMVDLDVGLHRTGLQTPQQALELAQLVSTTKGLRLDGLMIYPGHVTCPVDQQAGPLAQVADLIQETLDLWKKHGLQARVVSGGSTPTAYQSHLMPQVNEIRPGTYIFQDMNCARGGFCQIEDCAARIICTVVSDAVPGKVVLDGGSKTLTSDRLGPDPAGGFGCLVDYPRARIVKLTEEHGEVELNGGGKPALGSRVTVIPNHICPVINLHPVLYLQHEDGRLEASPVDARGLIT